MRSVATASISTSPSGNHPLRARRIAARLGWFTLGFFILVVLWGAVVRATGSGGGCGANWPLCNGDFFPSHPRLATLIEFTHRSTSGLSTALLLALGIVSFRVTPPGHRARKAVLAAGFLLVTEALLGALLVLRHYVENNLSTGRVIAQGVHFTNTLLLMGAIALTAAFLSDSENKPHAPRPEAKPLAIIAVLATILVGATGALAALADTLFPSSSLSSALAADWSAGSPVLVRMRWVHPAAAVLGLVCVLLLMRGGTWRRNRGTLLLGLLAAQFVLGILDVLLLAPTWMQIVHLFSADLYWVALVLFAAEIVWPAPGSSPILETRSRLP